MNDDISENAAAYVLGALSPEEHAEFEKLLETSDEARAAVAEFLPLLADMGDAAGGAVEPPESVRKAVMAEVRSTATVVPLDPERRRGSLGRTLLAAAASAVLMVGLAIGFTFLGSNGDRVEDVLAAEDALHIPVRLGDSELVLSHDVGAYALHGSAPEPDHGHEYQIWYVTTDGVAHPGPTFVPGEDGAYVASAEHTFVDVVAFAVSVEPTGGSDQPTTQPVAVAELPA